MARYLFGGFGRCLYTVQKFEAEGERKLAMILEREAIKWFRPAKGQFQIFYRKSSDYLEYQPDFAAETIDTIFMNLKPATRWKTPLFLPRKRLPRNGAPMPRTIHKAMVVSPGNMFLFPTIKLPQTLHWMLWRINSAHELIALVSQPSQ